MTTAKDKTEKEKPELIEAQKAKQLSQPEAKKLVEAEAKKMLGKPDEERLEELEEKLLRFQAEFDNFRKRTAKEHEMLRQSAGASVVLNLLEVVDEFGMAMEHAKDAKEGDFREGMEMIYMKLLEALKRVGLEEMKAAGETFDPYRHDAIGYQDGEEGKIMKVVTKGYSYKGKILRHAKVVVGRKEEK